MPDLMKMGKNPDYLGSWDLEDLPKREITLTIKSITEKSVPNGRGQNEKCAVCEFSENVKPMILNPTNKKMLVKLFKTKDTDNLRGKKITIGLLHGKWFGEEQDALRIRPVVPAQTAPKQSDTIKCEGCGKAITAAHGMDADKLAQYTSAKYGKKLCANCAAEQAKAGAE